MWLVFAFWFLHFKYTKLSVNDQCHVSLSWTIYWCNFDLFTYCIFIFWTFDTANTFVIFTELDLINFFLMNISFWHVMLMKCSDELCCCMCCTSNLYVSGRNIASYNLPHILSTRSIFYQISLTTALVAKTSFLTQHHCHLKKSIDFLEWMVPVLLIDNFPFNSITVINRSLNWLKYVRFFRWFYINRDASRGLAFLSCF